MGGAELGGGGKGLSEAAERPIVVWRDGYRRPGLLSSVLHRLDGGRYWRIVPSDERRDGNSQANERDEPQYASKVFFEVRKAELVALFEVSEAPEEDAEECEGAVGGGHPCKAEFDVDADSEEGERPGEEVD